MDVKGYEEVGPIDYLLVEWPGRLPDGEVAPYLIDLVDRGLIRILDLAFIVKDESGNVTFLDIESVAGDVDELAVLEGAVSRLLDEEGRADPGAALEPGTAVALLVFEKDRRWAEQDAPRPQRLPRQPHPPREASRPSTGCGGQRTEKPGRAELTA